MVENKGIDNKLFKYIVNTINNTPYNILLGIKPRIIGDGFAEVEIKSSEKHLNENHDHGSIKPLHGGVILSLADAVMGNAVRSQGAEVVTVDCSTNFVSPATLGDIIIGRGRVLKAGRKLIFASAEFTVDDRLVATAYGTFYKIGDYRMIIQGLNNE